MANATSPRPIHSIMMKVSPLVLRPGIVPSPFQLAG
jgi:hypothetical protein